MPAPNSGPLAFSVKGRVDLLDMYAAVLDGFDAGGELDELARCGFRVREGTFGGELQAGA